MSSAGSLLKRRDVLPGYSYLDIDIEKIDLKDSGSYADPFLTVSVKGSLSCLLLCCCHCASFGRCLQPSLVGTFKPTGCVSALILEGNWPGQ